MALLDFLKAAVQGTAAARGGYLQGQSQGRDAMRERERQSALDQIKQAMDQSVIDANNARARSYDETEPVTYRQNDAGEFYQLPTRRRRSGASTGTAPSAGAPDFSGRLPLEDFQSGLRGGKPPASPLSMVRSAMGAAPEQAIGTPTGMKGRVPQSPGARLSRSNVINPASGMVEDVYSDGTRKEVRKATAAELARANRVPGTGSSRGSIAGGGGKPLSAPAQDTYFSKLASSAVAAADQQIPPNVTGDERARLREQYAVKSLTDNPNTADIFTKGMSSRHIQAANQAFGGQEMKGAQAAARTNYQIFKDNQFPVNVPGSAAAARSTAQQRVSTPNAGTTGKKPLAARVAELKAMGYTKEQARTRLKDEGYKLTP